MFIRNNNYFLKSINKINKNIEERIKEDKIAEIKPIAVCPYCRGTKIIKSGIRKKKLENVQVFYCQHCHKKFTPLITKNKTYPIAVILKSLIGYNRFDTGEKIINDLKKQYGFDISLPAILSWIKEYENYQPFLRMREFLAKKINDKKAKLSDFIFQNRLFHQQIYDFGYHRAKLEMLINEDYKNYKLRAIKDFLELSAVECPHQIFKESQTRASEFKDIFDLDEVRITRKNNQACEMCRFVMQAVANNKLRHERLQEFMLFCDSVTIAVETPIFLDKEDLEHYRTMLNFKVPLALKNDDDVITGHIDFIQLRNGMIHIMDYKPSASKVKPIEQLTVYALALARLTSLRLYNFKCAWFDEDDYFEFYPLHVVYKKNKKKKKKSNFLTIKK